MSFHDEACQELSVQLQQHSLHVNIGLCVKMGWFLVQTEVALLQCFGIFLEKQG